MTFGKACQSVCDRTGTERVSDETSLQIETTRSHERRGIRMPEETEHHRAEQVVVGLIPTPPSYAYITACNQLQMAFPLITGGLGVGTAHLVTPKCKEESYAVPEQEYVLADQSIQCLISREHQSDEQLSILVIPTMNPYEKAYPHD